jgi:hypothetical protein
MATAALGATATEIGVSPTVTTADADFVPSVTDVAVSVTAVGFGTFAGAVYIVACPLPVFPGDTLPHPGEHAAPFCVSVQFTPAFAGSFPIVAVNCVVAFVNTVAVVGLSAKVIDGTVIVATCDFVGSATDVADTVTFRSLDCGVGAV